MFRKSSGAVYDRSYWTEWTLVTAVTQQCWCHRVPVTCVSSTSWNRPVKPLRNLLFHMRTRNTLRLQYLHFTRARTQTRTGTHALMHMQAHTQAHTHTGTHTHSGQKITCDLAELTWFNCDLHWLIKVKKLNSLYFCDISWGGYAFPSKSPNCRRAAMSLKLNCDHGMRAHACMLRVCAMLPSSIWARISTMDTPWMVAFGNETCPTVNKRSYARRVGPRYRM